MKKGDDPRIQAAKWFIEFLSEDLGKLSSLDFAKRAVEAQHYFMGPLRNLHPVWGKGDEITLGSFPRLKPDDPKGGVHLIVSPWPKDYPWEKNLPSIQKELKNFFEETLASPRHDAVVDTIDLLFGLDGEGTLRMRINFPIEDYEKDPSAVVRAAKRSFVLALGDIPAEAIRTCQECGKYFLHLSKKERSFCSPRCTSRAMAKRDRERDPDKYRAKQRKIMKIRYKEKKAQELGISVSKVSIRKRIPRKEA